MGTQLIHGGGVPFQTGCRHPACLICRRRCLASPSSPSSCTLRLLGFFMLLVDQYFRLVLANLLRGTSHVLFVYLAGVKGKTRNHW